ncbi:MAG: membrane protein insertion efficiency factor YidD [Chlamydiia bacterium]|nr:membrane protein insertion efficiency factor YidD [Chlamydiia bacterium]
MILLICFSLLIAEAPWGKDTDLTTPLPCCSTPSEADPLSGLALTFIRFHQEVISPADGPRSHFYPSSSQYTKEAIHRFGLLFGSLHGFDRLMRENEDRWVYRWTIDPNSGYPIKYDPIRCPKG